MSATARELADPDALLRAGRSLLDAMPATAAATAGMLRDPPRSKDPAQTERLRRWFTWISTRVGNGQLVAHCISESELRAAWLKSERVA